MTGKDIYSTDVAARDAGQANLSSWTRPDVELRPFQRNLQHLEIVECTDEELLRAALDTYALACYVKSEDKRSPRRRKARVSS